MKLVRRDDQVDIVRIEAQLSECDAQCGLVGYGSVALWVVRRIDLPGVERAAGNRAPRDARPIQREERRHEHLRARSQI